MKKTLKIFFLLGELCWIVFKYYDRVPKQVSQRLIFDFPFVRPYKVTFLGILDQKGLIKYYFFYKMIHISQNELFKF